MSQMIWKIYLKNIQAIIFPATFLRAMNKPFHMLYWNSIWKAATKVIMQFH